MNRPSTNGNDADGGDGGANGPGPRAKRISSTPISTSDASVMKVLMGLEDDVADVAHFDRLLESER